MKLLLFDHNLSPKLIQKLNDIYPDSAHVSQLGLDTASDKEVRRHKFSGFDEGIVQRMTLKRFSVIILKRYVNLMLMIR